MFDIAWSELLVIGIVAIIVVGPKDLPRLMRTFGHYAGKLRRMAADFQHQFDEAMREAEVEEVRKAMESVRNATPGFDLSAPIDRPVMLPKPAAATSATEPALTPKAKVKTKKASSAKSRKTPARRTQAPKTRVSKTQAAKTSPRARKGETT
jgi:sec-independent protein translocase protein TatB